MKSLRNQLVLPINFECMIDDNDPVWKVVEICESLDYTKLYDTYLRHWRKVDPAILFEIIVFAYMNGICSSRDIESACKHDIRFMWLLQNEEAPDHSTIARFQNEKLVGVVEDLFYQFVEKLYKMGEIEYKNIFIDGTKIEANANKYTRVWKKSCEKNRDKIFLKVTDVLEEINKEELCYLNVEFETRTEYAIEYLDLILQKYKEVYNLNPEQFVSGKGHRKSKQQRRYQQLEEYRNRLSQYAKHIEVCGESRNSYSKTDKSATFMRVKRDYMGNDQLLPAYNMQIAVCDEYIAAIDVKQYASDMDCFVPLMEKFKQLYGYYPKYPIADAGYGSFNNYIFCQLHGMEKFIKFTMFEKETKDVKYRENPYRAVNFKQNENGELICPQNRKFNFKYTRAVRGNKYGRTEEMYECEDCGGCPHKEKCCPKAKGNRIIKMNRELTAIHEEVVSNLCSIHGALLCMNRSIQSEGTFGVMKWDRSY